MRKTVLLFVSTVFLWEAACDRGFAQTLGSIPAGGFRSPEGDPRFSAEAGVKPLNNLVFELLNVESAGAESHTFRNPRDGWVYVRISSSGNPPPAAVRLDDQNVPLKIVNAHPEAMRYVAQGPHRIAVHAGGASRARLEVRSVGELVYAAYGENPHIAETGVHTWQFLREHCLDHYNGIIGASARAEDGKSTQEAEIREWTGEGKRWFVRESVPYDVSTADAAYDRWSSSLGMQHPLMSGIWTDEFGVGEKYGKKTVDMYPIWIEAIRRLRANPKHANRAFYAYGPSRLLPVERFEEMSPFIQMLMDCDYRTGPEWYIPEGQSRPNRTIATTEDLLAEFSPGWEQASRGSFEHASRGAAANRVVAVGVMSEPGWETCDISPDYNFNVFLDCQLQFMATDPAFFGIRGLQNYSSGYCGEEQTRLFAKLVRHYAIEGNTKRFLDDPYVLPHLQNGDFVSETSGWTCVPAVSKDGDRSIAAKTVPGLGVLQGRYHTIEGTGNAALWTRRSGEKPNVISQPLRNLAPGRLYSLRFITGDFAELERGESVRRKHGISVDIEQADVVAGKSFQADVAAGYWYPGRGFDANRPYWLNYHQVVFRAQGDSSALRLSDWVSDQSAGGPVGEELIWNFIQVQPYCE